LYWAKPNFGSANFDRFLNDCIVIYPQRIADYPNLENYTREIYQMPGMRETVNMAHIKVR
jgi:glutathionyl-hydroquinone reductase